MDAPAYRTALQARRCQWPHPYKHVQLFFHQLFSLLPLPLLLFRRCWWALRCCATATCTRTHRCVAASTPSSSPTTPQSSTTTSLTTSALSSPPSAATSSTSPPSDGSILPLLPTDIVYSAVEPNPFVLSSFASNAAAAGFPVGTIALANTRPLRALRSLPDSSKDAVIACEALSKAARDAPSTAQADDRDGLDALLTEVHRVLKPGGRLYFVDYTARNAADRTARMLQSVLTPFTRIALAGVRLDVPVAQRVRANREGWETVHVETWATAQPGRVEGEEGEEGRGEVEVTGLQGVMPVVAGICVKRKAARLSQYANQSTSLLDELFQYGTVRSAKPPQPAAPPHSQTTPRGR